VRFEIFSASTTIANDRLIFRVVDRAAHSAPERKRPSPPIAQRVHAGHVCALLITHELGPLRLMDGDRSNRDTLLRRCGRTHGQQRSEMVTRRQRRNGSVR
jgi:hypothetical protein